MEANDRRDFTAITTADGRRENRRHVEPAFAIGFFLAALALRLWIRNPESVWLDEANSVLIAARSLGGILHALQRDGNPPVYYVLLHAWMRLFGDGEGALRLLSALLGATLPAALYLAGSRLSGRTAAFTAAFLALLWPLGLYYSGQIRMYALVPTLALLLVAAVLRARAPTAGRWGAVVVAALVLIWTHNYGMFMAAAIPVAWLLQGPRTQRGALLMAAALAAIALIDLLWLPTVFRQSSTEVGEWIGREFHPAAPLQSLLLFGAGFNYPHYLQTLSGPLPTAPVAVIWLAAGTVALFAGVFLARRERALALPLLAFLVVPIALPYAASLLGRPIYLAGRYEVVAYPAFALLAGATGEHYWNVRSRRRGLARAAVLVFLGTYALLSAVTLYRYQHRPAERTEEKLAHALEQVLAPGDAVLTTGLSRAPLEYYLRRAGWSPSGLGKPLRLESYPRETAEHLGWFDRRSAAADPARMRQEADDLVGGLRGFKGKVFLVDHNGTLEIYTLQEPLRALLRERSIARRTLVQAGANPNAAPLYEISVYRMAP